MAPRRSNPTGLGSFLSDCFGEQPRVRTWTFPSNAQSGETLSGVRVSPATALFAPSRAGKLWPAGYTTSFWRGSAVQLHRISCAPVPIFCAPEPPAPTEENGYTTLLPRLE